MESQLKRGLFGYSRKSVTAVVNDREMSVIKSTREAKEASGGGRGARRRARPGRVEIADLQARNRDLELKLEDAAERFRAVERSGSTSTTEELTDVLHAAERALSRLTDGARKNAEKQLGETEQVHDALRQDIDRLAAWRARMAPLAERCRIRSRRCGRRRRPFPSVSDEALAPANEALDALAARLSELAESPEPPPQMPAAVARSSRWVRQRTDPRRSYPTRGSASTPGHPNGPRRRAPTSETACAWSGGRPNSHG